MTDIIIRKHFIKKYLSVTNVDKWVRGKYGFGVYTNEKITESFMFELFEKLSHYILHEGSGDEGIKIIFEYPNEKDMFNIRNREKKW